jgi:RNA polymerase sigma factor (TIGR02999 family)
MPPDTDLTTLLNQAETDAAARDQVVRLVEGELRRIGHRLMQRSAGSPDLQTTVLVNEVFVKLYGSPSSENPGRTWASTLHFYRYVARAMRNIQIDYYRRRREQINSGDDPVVDPHDAAGVVEQADFMLALDTRLTRLREEDADAAEVFELFFFGIPPEAEKEPTQGKLSVRELAEILDWKPYRVRTALARARCYLGEQLSSLGLEGSSQR